MFLPTVPLISTKQANILSIHFNRAVASHDQVRGVAGWRDRENVPPLNFIKSEGSFVQKILMGAFLYNEYCKIVTVSTLQT